MNANERWGSPCSLPVNDTGDVGLVINVYVASMEVRMPKSRSCDIYVSRDDVRDHSLELVECPDVSFRRQL